MQYVEQIGGSHYGKEGKYQHWDLMDDYNVSYLEGGASKYLTRFRDKNGVQDLEKAHSYIKKRLAALQAGKAGSQSRKFFIPPAAMEKFFNDAELRSLDRRIMFMIFTWHNEADLKSILRYIKVLKEDYEMELSEAAEPTGAYVNQG